MFSKDFLWGTATASHQIEGAYNVGGKVPDVWGELYKGHTFDDENGHVACDHYNRYKEDVKIMKKIGVNSYRFSVSWSRIIKNKEQEINEEGIKFYNNLINELIKAKIEPILTIFHWDMPMWAYDEGGWKNDKIIEWFKNYTQVLVNNFSDRVKYWITMNEPVCFACGGYEMGFHAPFEINDIETSLKVGRNVLLSHGYATRIIREKAILKPLITFSVSLTCYSPLNNSKEEIEIAKAKTFEINEQYPLLSNAFFQDPIYLGINPKGYNLFNKNELEIVSEKLDFFSYNGYTTSESRMEIDRYQLYRYPGMPRNCLKWIISPSVMYYANKFFYERYKLPIMISENGFPNTDFVFIDNKVHDPQRIDFINRYLKEIKRSIDEGVPVIGYMYWSLIDNFEWCEGYNARFGLVYVDYKNQNRILKDSAFYYKKVIKTNGECI